MQPPEELVRFLESYDEYHLVSHVEPDGDCLSSSLALGRILSQRGKEVHHYNPGPFIRAEIQRYLPEFSQEPVSLPTHDRENAAAIVLDCSNADRVGGFAERIRALPLAVVDHHASREAFGDVSYIDPEAPSTTYLILLLARSLGVALDPETASHLFFGLCTDTGYFRHLDYAAGDSFRAAGELTDAGASPKTAYDLIFGGKTMASRLLNARLLQRAEAVNNGAGYLTWETEADTEEFGKNNRDSDTLYQLLLGTQDCHAVALLREEPRGGCSGSLRSNDDTDVSAIAKHFGGGGHKRAAGFLIERSWSDVKAELLPMLEAALRRNASRR